MTPGRTGAAAALLAAGLYAGTLGAGFVYDDHAYVVNNPDLRGGPGRVPELFAHAFPSQAPERGLYRPLTALTLWLDRAPGGTPEPWRHHLTNLVLVAAATLAAQLALRRIVPPGAAAAGAVLFAVHPVHAEAVAWVTGRSELLAAGLACAAFALLVDAGRGRGGTGKAIGGGALLFAGMLAKENAAVALPLAALALAACGGARRGAAALALAAGTAGIAAAGLAKLAAVGALGPASAETVGPGGLFARLPLAVAATGEHLRLLLWPDPLHLERMLRPPTRWMAPPVVAGGAVLLAWLGVMVGVRRRPAARLLVAWPLAALLPVMHLVPIGDTVAERFLVLPSVGFCGLIAWALTGAGPLRGVRRGLGAGLVVLGAAMSVAAARPWSDEARLWRHVTAHVPESAGAWAGLGDASAHAGRPQEATVHYRRALAIDPGLTVARLGLAAALDAAGDAAGALEESRRAAAADPDHPAALNNLGARLARAGRPSEAAPLFRRAIEISPRYAPALRNAAQAALDLGRPAEAGELLRRARAADPGLPGLAELEARLRASPEDAADR
jgi:tetratricopeptide (TPR) repeat protein